LALLYNRLLTSVSRKIKIRSGEVQELTDVGLAQLITLRGPEDEDSDAAVERTRLTTSALKTGLQLVDGLVNNYL
jgi:hypothetical protein